MRVLSNNKRPASVAHGTRRLLAAAALALVAPLAGVAASCGSEPTVTFPCDPRRAGHCPDGIGGAGGAGGAGGSGPGILTVVGSGQGGAIACSDVNVTFKQRIPTVLLLIDQSNSMNAAFPGSTSRWQAIYDSLMDPQIGVVATLEDQVRFGLALYTYKSGSPVCPALTEVTYAIGNHDEIDAVLAQASPVKDTPTGDSIDAVVPGLLASPEPGPKVIVLATDGEPDTCEVPDPQTGQAEAIAAAQSAHALGIPTYIVSVGDEVSQAHLQDMANAGAGLPVGGTDAAPYFIALDQQALLQAFHDIINGVRSCVIELDGTLDAEEAAAGNVLLDGQELSYNDPDGWRFDAPNLVELTGGACQMIQSGDHEIQVTFPCGVVTIE